MNKRLNEKLLKDAFVEAMLRKYEREMEGCEESPICSPEHYKKMSEIVGFDVTKPRRSKQRISMRKKIVIIMIAAVLALTGCVTGYIYRHEIGNFIEEVYENYIKIYFDDETPTAPTEIEDVYTLTYVPKGYVLNKVEMKTILLYYQYVDESGNLLTFEQYVLKDLNQIVDSEDGNTSIIEYGEFIIYYKNIDNRCYYKFHNKSYAFSISAQRNLPEIEIKKMIEGLAIE